MTDLQEQRYAFRAGSPQYVHKYAIVGCSFTGISCFRTLKKLVASSSSNADESMILFEKGNTLGEHSPLSYSSGANIFSFNIDEAYIQKILPILEDNSNCIKLIDDGLRSFGMLSRTNERPTGWNRVTGQWQHYRKRKCVKDTLTSLLSDCYGPFDNIICNRKIVSFEYVPERECWRIKTDITDTLDNSLEYYQSKVLVLAIPAEDTLSILQASYSSLSTCMEIADLKRVLTALESSCDRNITRYATCIRVNLDSNLGKAIEAKFKEHYCDSICTMREQNRALADKVYELDVSQIGSKDITLITNIIDDVEYKTIEVRSEKIDQVLHLHLAVHALKREVLESRDELLTWLYLWTGLSNESLEDSDFLDFDPGSIKVFHQPPMGVTCPLSPLRESGYILISERPVLIAAGDFCVSPPCVSSALLSGEKAAKAVINLQL